MLWLLPADAADVLARRRPPGFGLGFGHGRLVVLLVLLVVIVAIVLISRRNRP